MQTPISVTHKYTSVPYIAIQWLRALPEVAAFDFEAAVKYSKDVLKQVEEEHEVTESKTRKRELHSILKATALSHPTHVTPTHLSVATSEDTGFVIIIDTVKMRDVVMNFLVTTEVKQIWHNASYDFKLIYYYSGNKLPKNYEDTALLAKCLLNHVESYRAGVKLKDMMGYKYGAWAVTADYFDLESIHDKALIKYAAIDACATYALWEEMLVYLEEGEPDG